MKQAVVFLVFALTAFGAEEAHGDAGILTSKWIHFGLLLVLVVLLWRKFASPAIQARSVQINGELVEARRQKAESDSRVAAIESRLGNLETEIAAFRAESQKMIEAEGAKIRRETTDLTARVFVRGESEIASLTKAATAEVKAEAARQALRLAEQRIAHGVTPEVHSALINGFFDDLRKARV